VRGRSRKPCRSAGFSLIEVLVALAIVGLALAAAAETLGIGLTSHDTAKDAAAALAVAEDEIAQAGAGAPLRAETRDGNFADRFAWRLVVAPYDEPQSDRFAEPASNFRLFRVAVTVSWQDGRRQRRLALATVRLGRAPP
jgi:general secretion pathway protein I